MNDKTRNSSSKFMIRVFAELPAEKQRGDLGPCIHKENDAWPTCPEEHDDATAVTSGCLLLRSIQLAPRMLNPFILSVTGRIQVLTEDERKQRRRLSQAKSKVKQFEAKAQRAELRAAFWRRRLADLQFEQSATYQPPLWPPALPVDALTDEAICTLPALGLDQGECEH
jgi:hypothetical protein